MLIVLRGSIETGALRLLQGTPITDEMLKEGVLSARDVEQLLEQGILGERPEARPDPTPVPQRVGVPRWDGYDISIPNSILCVPVADLPEALGAVADAERLREMAEADSRLSFSRIAAHAYMTRARQLGIDVGADEDGDDDQAGEADKADKAADKADKGKGRKTK